MRWLLRLAIALGLVALAAGAVLARFAWDEYRRRSGLYGYDVASDNPLAFVGNAPRVAVELVDGVLRWPLARGACHSAFARVAVDATLLGRWVEPAVRVRAEGAPPFDQYLERGARGARWLNLSPLCAQSERGAAVRLEGRALDVRVEPVEIATFAAPDWGAGPLLVIAPHPDDAEIAAFGLYRARKSYLVAVTAGDYAGRGLEHLAATEEERALLRGRLRVWDSFAVPLLGGVPTERVANLGYRNGSLEALYARGASPTDEENAALRRFRGQIATPLLPARQAEATWESLVEDLVDVVRRVAPGAIAAPHPVLDVSLEHQLATVALLEALARLGDPPALLLLYTNHAGTELFPYGPADGLVTLPRPTAPLSLAAALSFPLGPDAVLDKLFALEAMHDLRRAPHPVLGEATWRDVRTARRLLREWWNDPHDYYSYLRRAARPNEVLFPVATEERAALRALVPAVRARARAGDRTPPPAPPAPARAPAS